MTPYHISTLLLSTLLLLITYLTAARWLQHRSAWLTHHAEVDAIYILAGAPSRTERMDALLDWIKHYDCRPATILIPEDRATGLIRSPQGNLLPVAHCQLERLHSAYPSSTPQTHIAAHKVEIVPGHYHGTDGEMQALANYLEPNPSLRRVALVTSRFHIRRALRRARVHIGDLRIIGVLPARVTISDYVPRWVLMEYLQLLRDQLGFTNAPFLHRGWWVKTCARHGGVCCARRRKK